MTMTLDFTDKYDLTLAPETPEEETMQNLYCLLNTVLAEVPCYRNYGLDMSYLASPMNMARTMIVSAIAEAVSEFFPELRVGDVEFTFDGDTPDAMGCRIEVTDDDEES